MAYEISAQYAFEYLKKGMDRNVLIQIIAESHNSDIIVKSFIELNLEQSERDLILSYQFKSNITILLLEKNVLSYNERLKLLSKAKDAKVALSYIKIFKDITIDEEEHIVRLLTLNTYDSISLFKSDIYQKISKSALDKIKVNIFKERAGEYIKLMPNADDRGKAFAYIIRYANSSGGFLIDGKPTKAERISLLKKISMSRTALRLILNSVSLSNHDKVDIAKNILISGDLHLAKIMYEGCDDRNVHNIINPLMTMIKLTNK